MIDKILVYKCGLDEYGPKVIENNLESFQNEVGGYIEYYYIGQHGDRRLRIVLNKKGFVRGLPYNFETEEQVFFGNVFIIATEEGDEGVEFEVSLTPEDIDWIEEWILENVIDDDKEV